MNLTLTLTPLCQNCRTPIGNPLQCEFLLDQRDGVKCKNFTKTKNMMRTCGFCSYYKTPKCTFSSEQGYKKKVDVACNEFHLDRHLAHLNRKPKLVLRHHGKR